MSETVLYYGLEMKTTGSSKNGHATVHTFNDEGARDEWVSRKRKKSRMADGASTLTRKAIDKGVADSIFKMQEEKSGFHGGVVAHTFDPKLVSGE